MSFHTAGLRRRTHNDEWHIDTVLSFATDECVPQKINGEYIGANHAWPAGVVVFLPDHGKTVADVGSLWKDEAGLSWTLMRIGNEENLFRRDRVGGRIHRRCGLDRRLARRISSCASCRRGL